MAGTEEGCLRKCSAASNAEHVAAYAGHEGGVYAVAWNRRHARLFLSASADWTVKLWHDARPKVPLAPPLLARHVPGPVCSAAPAPLRAHFPVRLRRLDRQALARCAAQGACARPLWSRHCRPCAPVMERNGPPLFRATGNAAQCPSVPCNAAQAPLSAL